ncbi:LapA family protein [Novosphingobium sp. FSW06-99]|uniref:LapA family protein n=1 Tax=Novosphingobium sp. FSW06-99 TaxID=1739113 RepID=UPI00076C4E76|nr:LapA family protein [Novosphingobium sp. FSW06-99]KUR74082.1 hypothetical protein AQZ49_19280 [Novosphingobium sp. FSW06-99]
MNALKTVYWIAVATLLLAFIYGNPDPVAVHIWPGLIWETKSWALVVGSLLIGFVPTSLMLRATRWRLTRRIATLEATLAAQAHALTHAAEQASRASDT